MSEWKIIGQVGNIIKKKECYLINIAENKYKKEIISNENGKEIQKNKKEWVIWFNCISRIRPNIKIGDTVIAEGHFKPSKNGDFPFTMCISHIGVINDSNKNNLKNTNNIKTYKKE